MTRPASSPSEQVPDTLRRPRLAFLGVGWIGSQRLKFLAESGAAQIVAVSDADQEAARRAALHAPGAVIAPDIETLLGLDLDGAVIATPTALHAEQAVSFLGSGIAVFCQKPLGRSAAETALVIAAARASDRLLAVDMSYRFVRAFARIKDLARSGAIGEIYACDLSFHNAYGPDKPWYYDRRTSGGGCIIDLGIHLVDLALWMLDFPAVAAVSSRRFARGRALTAQDDALEDYAVARVDLASGATVNLACSWHLPAGRDAVIRAAFFGTQGGLAVTNVNGSFYDFRAEQYHGTATEILDDEPDAWGGRALNSWVTQLSLRPSYDPAIETAQQVAAVLDAIYGREPVLKREPHR